MTDINGPAFGTLTIADVTLNGTGQALNLSTGTLAATFGSILSTNSTLPGISLTSVAGSLTSGSTTITQSDRHWHQCDYIRRHAQFWQHFFNRFGQHRSQPD